MIGVDAGRQRASRIVEHLEGRREAMVGLLVELARMESPTDRPETQGAVQARLSRALRDSGFRVRTIPGTRTGGHLFACPVERRKGRPSQLLLGHTDTVWPVGTRDEMPVEVSDGYVHGPGTFDMKGGLVQGLFAIDALRDLGLDPPATPVWLVNSDEEIGSPESRRWVARVARHVARAFVLEPALGPEGLVKTARKGVARFTVTVRGRAAHAGLDPTGGASAIAELARLVPLLHGMTDLERGTTVNVGVVHGGTRPNVIAAQARAEVDVRVLTVDEGERIAGAIRGLRAETPGTSVEVAGDLEVPPLERTSRNRALWQQALAAAERLGIELGETTAGGGSDGNTTSQHTATLDGLGPIGDGAHAPHECVRVEGMVERAALLAELLMAPVGGAPVD